VLLIRPCQKANGRDRPRLWCVVTGELGFLPIHAAGKAGGVGKGFTSDYVVFSYVPTLSALARARSNWKPIPRSEVCGALVCEASSGRTYLPSVLDEVNVVRGCLESAQAKVVSTATEHTSRAQMHSMLTNSTNSTTQILHLASHGVQDEDPLQSGFELQDGRFSIEDLMRLDLPHAVLAFLSACQTAKGDRHAPDQAVHLAASMLFCGFRSVIGTLWCVSRGCRRNLLTVAVATGL
jgi:CHAT domain-containing protein